LVSITISAFKSVPTRAIKDGVGETREYTKKLSALRGYVKY
jgi:hypothetical protein